MTLRDYALDPLALARSLSGSLSPVLRGEGWGEGPFSRGAHFVERPLTLTLSPEYRGEGIRKIARTRARSLPGAQFHPNELWAVHVIILEEPGEFPPVDAVADEQFIF